MNTNQQKFVIRKAEIADATTLAKIGADTFYHTFRPYNSEEDMQAYLEKSYANDVIINNLGDQKVHYFLCEQSDLCIGYIKLLEGNYYDGVGANAIELEKIYVYHDFFGTEAAKLLLQTAIIYAKKLGYSHLFLGVWQENKRAISFYMKNNFITVATRSFKLGEKICDDYIMQKVL